MQIEHTISQQHFPHSGQIHFCDQEERQRLAKAPKAKAKPSYKLLLAKREANSTYTA